MEPSTDAEHIVLNRMQSLIEAWESATDNRAIFLSCYSLMTRNMLAAIERGEFEDGAWVLRLLVRFAEYYFIALDAYEQQRDDVPAVWHAAFEASTQPGYHVLQHLILGVNAHICYDLVFVVVEMLRDEWAHLPEAQRKRRYRDHCHVNEIIYQTIDRVQTEVIERHSPIMDVVDKMFGVLDEWALYKLISHWREDVWESALSLLACADEPAVVQARQRIGDRSLTRAHCILGEQGIAGLLGLL